MNDEPEKTTKGEPTFAGEIGAKAARKLKARKSTQGVWFGLGMMGLVGWSVVVPTLDRKSTRLNSSHTEIYTLSLHDALPIWCEGGAQAQGAQIHAGRLVRAGHDGVGRLVGGRAHARSEEHTSELQSHRDLHSFPTRRSSDLVRRRRASSRRANPRRASGSGWA